MIFWKKNIDVVMLWKKWNVILWLFLLLGFSNNTLAQRGGGGGSFPTDRFGGSGTPSSNQKVLRKISKDSLLIFYYFIENPNQEYPYQDTLLDSQFHQFDPARSRVLDYATLGYLGSPIQSLFYENTFRQGFDVGLHQYDAYKIKAKDLRFYNLKTAYSDFYFSQGGSQDDIQLKAKFSRNFSNNMNLSLDYHRISQFGTPDPIAYFFQDQRARHTAFAGGMAFKNDAKTYQSFFAFSNNIHQQEDNGGIQSDTFFLNQEDGFSSNLAIPVWLDGANTRHSEREISYTQYYIYNPKTWKANRKRKAEEKARRKTEAAARDSLQRLVLKDSINTTSDSLSIISKDSLSTSKLDSISTIAKDTIPISKTDTLSTAPKDSTRTTPVDKEKNKNSNRPNRGNDTRPASSFPTPPPPPNNEPEGRTYTISHRISHHRGSYKFSDATTIADTSYWKNLLLDERGVRHFLTFRKIENSLAISTFKARQNSRSKPQSQNDFLEIGVRHSFHWIDEEVADSTVNNLFLTGKWNFNPNENLQVKTNAHLGLWDNAGDYRVSGDFFFDLKKLGQLQLSGVNQLYSPNILQQRFYISKRNAWSNDFKPTLETNLSATYAYPKIGFRATGKYHLLNNFIYFDSLATPQQEGSPVSIFQLILEQKLKLRSFHFENTVILQQTTNESLKLPSIYSKHSIYYQGVWFRNALNIRLGLDARMNNSYFANTYNPLVGQFHLQNSQRVEFFPAIDFYTSFKVKQFRFFAKFENITRGLVSTVSSIRADEQYYQLASYPIQNNRFRMGLAWKFVD